MTRRAEAPRGGGSDSVYGTSPVKRRYRRTNAELKALDEAIVAAIEEDWPVSLRGVYYRVVSAGAAPKTEAAYKVVGRQLLKLRRAGVVSNRWITDGTRLIRRPASWDGLEDCLRDTAGFYKRDLWRKQRVEVMVFTEKDAISGILYPVTSRWDLPLGVLKGYASETFAYIVAEEIIDAHKRGKCVFLYQFGDHDPSGVDAWENFVEKVSAFVEERCGWCGAVFERLAVTPQQIIELNLPTRPTKKSDTRAKSFVGESVEVDAVPAPVLRQMCEEAIAQHIDAEALRITQIAENDERRILERIAGDYAPEA